MFCKYCRGTQFCPCYVCDSGRDKALCDTCDASGTIQSSEDDSSDGGAIEMKCHDCNGRGHHTCHRCRGLGQFRCDC